MVYTHCFWTKAYIRFKKNKRKTKLLLSFKLNKIDDVIDTEKLSEQGKNQWGKFKNWMSEQF